MSAPYYSDEFVELYHGDAREIVPALLWQGDTCIVDPVWPNSVFPDVADPQQLFADVCWQLTVDRLVVHLGCGSDPRFLSAVPERFPFLRTCWLRYARPSYRGRILVGSDVAYAFGVAPESRPGRHVLSGETVASRNDTKTQHVRDVETHADLPHPAPRRLEHVSWLVGVFAEKKVIDPFAGTGTTLLAAKTHGLRAVGVEIHEPYCELAAKRLTQNVLDFGGVA